MKFKLLASDISLRLFLGFNSQSFDDWQDIFKTELQIQCNIDSVGKLPASKYKLLQKGKKKWILWINEKADYPKKCLNLKIKGLNLQNVNYNL